MISRRQRLYKVFFAIPVFSSLFAYSNVAFSGTINVPNTCTLAAAITAANNGSGCGASSGANTINLTADITLTSSDNLGDGFGPNGLPIITSTIIIEGNDHFIARSSIDNFRIFEVGATGNLTLDKVTIRNGNDASNSGGGGILNFGTLLITNSTIDGNNTMLGNGGGILNNSTLTIKYSTVSNNSSGNGGGLFDSGTTVISSSYFYKNTGTNFGGGINESSSLTIDSTTIDSNVSSDGGGIFSTGGSIAISNSTITKNTSTSFDAGAIEFNGTLVLTLDTISNNVGAGLAAGGGQPLSTSIATIFDNNTTNCIASPDTDSGYNLSSDGSCNFTLSTPLANTDPKLGPLAGHGGPTLTEALSTSPKSPAIDAANNPCSLSYDQRGFIRPDMSGTACDIGAFETQTSKAVPSCNLNGTTTIGGKKAIVVSVTDSAVGVNEITATELTNATMTTSPAGSTMFSMAGDSSFYSPPTTTKSVTVTAVKVNSSLSSQLGLKIVNNVGNTVSCDPTLIEVVDGKGKQLDHINGTEHFLTIVNDGVNAIHMKVSGRNVLFSEKGKAKGNDFVLPKDGSTGHYNIAKYLHAGNNKLVISASGKPSGTATLLFSDSAPQH